MPPITPRSDAVRVIAVAKQGPRGVPGPGVPDGGTLGQILAKASGTDQDTEWIDPPQGGGAGEIAIEDVTGLQGALDAKATAADIAAAVGALAVADIDGLPAALEGKATPADIDTAINGLIASAPGTLDTLGEIAAELADQDSAVAALTTAINGKEPALPAGTSGQYIGGDKALHTLNKASVGLSAVNNTADADKPVSTAQAGAIADAVAGKVSSSVTGIAGALAIGNIVAISQTDYDALDESVQSANTFLVVEA